MALPPFLTSVINWVRAGYPEGVPQQDYIPLVALLSSQLSEADVAMVADLMADSGDADSGQAIKAAIGEFTHDKPLDLDVARVRARLAGGGWPLARPDQAS
jgi:hypothetical protein